MPSRWSRGRNSGDVEQEYSYRIEDLMNEFEPRTIPRLTKRSFDDLAKWARSTYNAKCESEVENQQLKRTLNQANSQITTLRNKLKEENKERQNLQAEYSETRGNLEMQIEQQKRVHAAEISSWESFSDELQARHKKETMACKANYDMKITELKANRDRRIAELRDEHELVTNGLLSGIMVAQAESRPWTDEKLKLKFNRLKHMVDKITSPHFGAEVRDISALGHLDSHGFLSRVGERPHFLLRNALWNILCGCFFSSPWGFGALGPGAGREDLVAIYSSWRGIFGTSTDVSEDTISAVFSSGRVANQWRSVTFESIMEGLMAEEESDLHTALRDTYESNIGHCGQKIQDLLLHSTGKCPDEKILSELTRSAAELGLQFGVQPSRMKLDRPEHKQVVEIGKGFVDCANGQINKGETVEVDLFSCPGLTRIGDGRKDFEVEISLVPGQVYHLNNR